MRLRAEEARRGAKLMFSDQIRLDKLGEAKVEFYVRLSFLQLGHRGETNVRVKVFSSCCNPQGQVQATARRPSSVSPLALTSQRRPAVHLKFTFCHRTRLVKQHILWAPHLFGLIHQSYPAPRRELQSLVCSLPTESYKAC